MQDMNTAQKLQQLGESTKNFDSTKRADYFQGVLLSDIIRNDINRKYATVQDFKKGIIDTLDNLFVSD